MSGFQKEELIYSMGITCGYMVATDNSSDIKKFMTKRKVKVKRSVCTNRNFSSDYMRTTLKFVNETNSYFISTLMDNL